MAAFPELAPFLAGNKRFVDQTNAANPEFLPTLSKAQAPPVLWLGCADSRVPETTITGAKPGDIFVHRNVANQFHPEDVSANAVLNFSVLTVGVQHVVVVGHTSCGGCNAAFGAAKPSEGDAAPTNPLLQWLGPLIKLRHSLPESATVDDLIRENVRVSVQNIVQSATMKEAWATGKPVYVHGWSYDLATGLITDLGMTQGPPQ